MKPATSLGSAPQVEATPVAPPQGQKSVGSGRGTRASATMLGLALSVGTTGTMLLGAGEAFAADATALDRLPTTEATTLPSVGSNQSATTSVAYHTVSDGETLWDIAQAHRVPVEAIKALNGLTAEEGAEPKIQVGQVIKVPLPEASAPVAEEEAATEVVVAAPSLPAPQLEETETATPGMVAAPSETGVVPGSTAPSPSAPWVAIAPSAPEAAAISPQASTEAEQPAQPQIALGPQGAPTPYSLGSSTPSTTPAPIRYQVQRGDTLAEIARRHGVAVEALVEANRISNPNRIRVGRTLVIPGAPSAPANVPPASSAAISPVVQVATAAPVRVVPAPSPAPAAAAVEDPFVGTLLADVAAARAQGNQPEAVAPVATTPEPTADATAPQAPLLLASSPAIAEPETEESLLSSAQIASSPSTTETVSQLSPSRQRELLAAAPLGSEAYAPINRTPVGQVVSPGMPMLPGTSEYLPEVPNRFAGYVWPAQGVLTSGFGWRWGRRHQGIDVAGPVGTPIVAAADGVVERSGWNSGGYGNMVDIRHADGSLTRYAHNSRNHVRVGQQVRQGQLIADMGSTGRSTGPHVHFEIHLPGSGPVNPIAHLPGR